MSATIDVRQVLDDLDTRYHQPCRDRDFATERDLSIASQAELTRMVPASIRDLYRGYEAADSTAYRIYDTERNLNPNGFWYAPRVIEANDAKDAAYTAFWTELEAWFPATIGRPMHNHEPGIFHLILKAR